MLDFLLLVYTTFVYYLACVVLGVVIPPFVVHFASCITARKHLFTTIRHIHPGYKQLFDYIVDQFYVGELPYTVVGHQRLYYGEVCQVRLETPIQCTSLGYTRPSIYWGTLTWTSELQENIENRMSKGYPEIQQYIKVKKN